jgi:hypothetical protein
MAMKHVHITRRQILKGAGAAGALGALAVPAAAFADGGNAGDQGERGIVGAWLIEVVPNGPASVPYKVLNLYTPGGGVAGVANNEMEPTNLSTSVYGAWEQTGPHKFAITFLLFTFTPQGSPSGTLKVRAMAALSQDSGQISGPAVIEFAPPGGSFFRVGTTTFTGTRITPEPI